MKQIAFITIFVALGLTSCKDFLSLSPEYQINEVNYYQSESDYETAIVGIYDKLQQLHYINFLYPAEQITDNTTINSYTWTTEAAEFDLFGIPV